MILLLIKLYFPCLAITDQILSAATSISHLNLSYFNLWFLCIPEKQRKLPNILLWACFFFVSLHLSLLSPLHSNIFQEFKGCTEAAVPKANREDEVVTAQRHIICCRGKYRILPKWFWHWWVIPPAPLGQINAVMRCSHQVPSVFGGLQKWALMVPFHWGSWGWLPKDLQWLLGNDWKKLAHLLPQHHSLCSSQAAEYTQDVKPSFLLWAYLAAGSAHWDESSWDGSSHFISSLSVQFWHVCGTID